MLIECTRCKQVRHEYVYKTYLCMRCYLFKKKEVEKLKQKEISLKSYEPRYSIETL